MRDVTIREVPADSFAPDRDEASSLLWSRFAAARNQEEYAQGWLALQCTMIAGTGTGLLAMKAPDQTYQPIACWPAVADSRLREIVEQVVQDRCGVVIELEQPADSRPGTRYGIGYPALVDEELLAVVALELAVVEPAALSRAMELLQWGVSWLELYGRRRTREEGKAALNRLQSSFDLLAGVLAEETFAGACTAFATTLANEFGCDRVGIGFCRGDRVKVETLSHSALLGKRMKLIRCIAIAMDEAIMQRQELLYPAPEGATTIVQGHAELARGFGAKAILTFPLYAQKESFYGAITLERQGEPFTREEVDRCRSLVALTAPALKEKRLNSLPLWRKAAQAAGTQLGRLIGPGHFGRKFAGVALLALVTFFVLAEGEYRLSADTTIEGSVRRALVAPFPGYIQESTVRAGDEVAEGAVLCTLDDRDLRLERLNLFSKLSQTERQYQEALAKRERAQTNILKAQAEQVEAQIELLETQLGRTRIAAPFAAIVLKGDLTQRLGGAVEQGEVLFEIAPLAAYRVILEVDESRIADVRIEQKGVLVLTALPDEKFHFTVEKVTPVSTARDGHNFFRVEAQLERSEVRLRPGMEGVGKISVDRRKLLSIWTRGLFEWLRLWVWSWWP